MAEEIGEFALVRTKMQRPWLPRDLIPWRQALLTALTTAPVVLSSLQLLG